MFLDDEPALLAGLERSLRPTRHSWQCEFLTDPLAALDRIASAPFEVIVSDMRMPGMSGAEFLARACQIAPDAVRVMLTGNNDLQTAMDAVNCGHVFQFVLKPCAGERLIEHLASAIYQQRLQLAEREVLRLKLEQADKMVVVGKLAAGITHDLNNILGAILIQAELNLMQEPEPAESSGLKLIHEAAKRAAELTREINNLSRTDSRPLLQRVDPAEVISGGVRVTQPLLGRKIKVTIQPAAPLPEILADAGRLKQALMNLLINARDAMPTGGVISITAEACRFEATPAPDPAPGRDIRPHFGHRHRPRHGRSHFATRPTTVLHHQTSRAGRRSRLVHDQARPDGSRGLDGNPIHPRNGYDLPPLSAGPRKP